MTDKKDAGEGTMRIEADLVRQLALLLNENELTEIEVEDAERRILVKREIRIAAAPAAAPIAQAAPAAPSAGPPVSAAAHPGTVKSPMVGTVYLSGEPGAKPFVSAGTPVKEGDTLLIVEAMKVMNPIIAPRAGIVREVLVADGQPIEFDQPLVIVE